ncbi:putative pectinesterase/pectinesterase inhibitor 22 [Acorus gramineus]|uniref:Pectinesterase n=1 Tax=Acorus gramineus TaxID=55184 RepID=A0AAV9BVU7_ACOGR|nr:putative pectinesterase/pectinesterase inhibitor 22 [Acorus gramineus]
MIRQACQNSSDPHSCVSDFQTECDRDAGRRDPAWVLGAAVKATIGEARRAIETVSSLTTLSNEIREQIAIRDCMELLDMSVEELGASMAELQRIQPGGAPRNARREENLKTWLSAALGNQDTCIEGFEATDGRIRNSITGSLRQVTRLVSNVLAEFKRVVTIRPSLPGNRTVGSEFPTWIGEEERGLVRMDPGTMHVDAVVAQDGSGRYRTIMAAVEEAPDHGERRYVIYVKRGVYRENVELKKKKSNIMMVGEGMGLTVVSSGRNFLQGWTTFRTATFAVSGRGFIARDMTFRNTAGPENRQAVALRVDSDQSAFFRWCDLENKKTKDLKNLIKIHKYSELKIGVIKIPSKYF